RVVLLSGRYAPSSTIIVCTAVAPRSIITLFTRASSTPPARLTPMRTARPPCITAITLSTITSSTWASPIGLTTGGGNTYAIAISGCIGYHGYRSTWSNGLGLDAPPFLCMGYPKDLLSISPKHGFQPLLRDPFYGCTARHPSVYRLLAIYLNK